MNTTDQAFLVQKIRTEYTEREHTQLDALRALDTKVKRPARVFAYLFGSIGALVMGSGMSLVMTEIGQTLGLENAMIPGVIVGAAGLVLILINYPLYKRILSRRKNKYAEQILALSDTLLKNGADL